MENSSVFVMRSAILGEFGTLHSSWCMLVLSHWLRNQYITGRFCQKKIQRFEHNYHPGIPSRKINENHHSNWSEWSTMIYTWLHFPSCVKLLEGNSWKPNIEQERAVVTLESAVYVPRMESILQLSWTLGNPLSFELNWATVPKFGKIREILGYTENEEDIEI